jgi:malonyl-CoA O-methyltransferase
MERDGNFDKRLVRRSFDKAAPAYDASAVLQHEVCRRMLSRLEFVKLAPATVLDAGCGTGNVITDLRSRYPHASLYALDIALEMVRHAVSRVPAWERVLGRRVLPVCADIEHLPLRFDSIDLVWSNLALQWVHAPLALAEFKRVLKPGGLLMFSTFGPDTLKELRAAYAGIDAYSHVNRFIDMHDLGDMLVHAGFADPVMDMEYITLTYGNVRALMRDLKAIGASSVSGVRASGMTTRSKIAALEARYENFRRDGKLPATFEVVYGHAWVPRPRTTADGKPVIPIKAAR